MRQTTAQYRQTRKDRGVCLDCAQPATVGWYCERHDANRKAASARYLQRQRNKKGIPVGGSRGWYAGHPLPPEEMHRRLIERFWKRVDKTQGLGPWGNCWEWTGSRAQGYGQIGMCVNRKPKPRRAHVVAWVSIYGHPEPPKGWHVCHRCNNKACVREDHLFPGTPLQNIRHAQLTGLMPIRAPRPEPSDYRVGLTAEQRRTIRLFRESEGVALVDLAHMAQMDKSHLSKLETGGRPCRLSQLVFILNFLRIDHAEFGLSSCPLKPIWQTRSSTAKYLTRPPQYVYRDVPFAAHLKKKTADWLVKLGTPKSDQYDAQALIDALDAARAKQGDAVIATGLYRHELLKVLRGTATDAANILAVIRYAESLKSAKAA